MDRRKVHTYDTTSFDEWYKRANMAFFRRGLVLPTTSAALDAYEMGESPDTWADYVRHDWPKVPGVWED